MNIALQKTLELLLIIAIGVLLQRKVPKKEQLDGLKTLILNVALPATIFLALLKIDFNLKLIALPILALLFNFLMFFASRYLLPLFIPIESNKKRRTLSMLIPSLAPGLSCFPFIIAYLSEEELALAALADVGNKLFGLLLLYLIAMHWYHQRKTQKQFRSNKTKLIDLTLTLLKEPINVVIVIGLLMLIAGINLSIFPEFIQNTIDRFSVMMVAMVLLFIGLAVRIKWREFGFMFQLLSWRSGMALLFSAIVLLVIPTPSLSVSLLIIAFPQSACSFWPFAHMNAVDSLEERDQKTKKTFDLNFAVTILACSLPFSTFMIIGIFHFGNSIVDPFILGGIGLTLVMVSLICRLVSYLRPIVKNAIVEKVVN
ncbi:AEC family transporter [Aegicerativicinus sediminis]|uniref:permease n=1 Tax=Aegicerativicinus sediminis TaxID=2893202 RepID=UPI001E56600B|nr:permease [Aegicerativicinus sediminis]